MLYASSTLAVIQQLTQNSGKKHKQQLILINISTILQVVMFFSYFVHASLFIYHYFCFLNNLVVFFELAEHSSKSVNDLANNYNNI